MSWEKRTIGDVLPGIFSLPLADKKNEAVANIARFADAGRGRERAGDCGLRVEDGRDLRRVQARTA